MKTKPLSPSALRKFIVLDPVAFAQWCAQYERTCAQWHLAKRKELRRKRP